MAFCTQCGKLVDDDAAFCTNCGAANQRASTSDQPTSVIAPDDTDEPESQSLESGAPPATDASAEESALTCASCGANIEPGTEFCVSCGAAIAVVAGSVAASMPPIGHKQSADGQTTTLPPEDQPRTCATCGEPLESGALFCTACGAGVSGTPTSPPPPPPSGAAAVVPLAESGPRRNRWLIPLLIAAVAMVLLAVGVTWAITRSGGDEVAEASTTSTVPASTTQAPTTSAPTTTTPQTTTAVPTTTTSVPPTTTVAPTTTTSAQLYSYIGGRYPSVAEGQPAYSGCTPGTTDRLPDGVWYGFSPSWSTVEIVFDLACVSYTYDAACSCDVPTVTNNNTLLRTLPFDSNATAYGAGDGSQTGPMSIAEFTADPGNDADAYRYVAGLELVISINNGLVTEIAIPLRP